MPIKARNLNDCEQPSSQKTALGKLPYLQAHDWDAYAVAMWLYLSYVCIIMGNCFAFGMVFQELGWTNVGLAQLTPKALFRFHLLAFTALLLNTLGITLYWKAFRTTLSTIFTALRLPHLASPNHSTWRRFTWIQSLAVYQPFKRNPETERQIHANALTQQYYPHYHNIMGLLLVFAWFYFTYTVVGLWFGLSIGVLLQKLGWVYTGFKEIGLKTFALLHLLGLATLVANRFAIPRHWRTIRTAFAMLIALTSLPLVLLHGIYRLKPIKVIYKLCVTRLLRTGWLRHSEVKHNNLT